MPITLTPAEQHIADQQRRDPISLDRRITKLEERLHSHEVAMRLDRRRFNLMGPGPSVQDIVKQEIDGTVRNFAADVEALKESLEGAWERIQALILRVDAKMLLDVGIPQEVIDKLIREPGKAEPFPGKVGLYGTRIPIPESWTRPLPPLTPSEFGAVMREDWDVVSGKREPDPAHEVYDPDRLARAYHGLLERLMRLTGGSNHAFKEQISELYQALGRPEHPGLGGDTVEAPADPQAAYNRIASSTVARIARRSHKLRIELLRAALEHAAQVSHSGSVHDSIVAALKADTDMERDYGHED